MRSKVGKFQSHVCIYMYVQLVNVCGPDIVPQGHLIKVVNAAELALTIEIPIIVSAPTLYYKYQVWPS